MITLALCLANTGNKRPAALDDPQFPRPVAAGMCLWDEDGVFSRYGGFVRQEHHSMSVSAEKLHGFTNNFAKNHGVPEVNPLRYFTNSLKMIEHLVVWDLDFDRDVIRSALLRDPGAMKQTNGNIERLVRPGVPATDLSQICGHIMQNQDANGEAVAPTLQEAVKELAPDVELNPRDPATWAEACRALFTRLCAENLISDMREAA